MPSSSLASKLLDKVREAIRVRHCSRRTEDAYVAWIRRFIVFHGKRSGGYVRGSCSQRRRLARGMAANIYVTRWLRGVAGWLTVVRCEVSQLTQAARSHTRRGSATIWAFQAVFAADRRIIRR